MAAWALGGNEGSTTIVAEVKPSAQDAVKNHAAFIWAVADLLRGDYKQSEYGKVILPLVVLRRLDCVLEPTKAKVLERHAEMATKADNLDPILEQASGQSFYNTSKLTAIAGPSIDGIAWKLTRAEVHLRSLQENMDAFVQGELGPALGLVNQFDFGRGKLVVKSLVPKELPVRWAVIVSEVLHHCRTSLDQLAWELVIANGAMPKKKRTGFPIFLRHGDEKDGFVREGERMIEQMSEPAKDLIRGLQPYVQWPDKPEHMTLAVLHELNNLDKHSVLAAIDLVVRR